MPTDTEFAVWPEKGFGFLFFSIQPRAIVWNRTSIYCIATVRREQGTRRGNLHAHLSCPWQKFRRHQRSQRSQRTHRPRPRRQHGLRSLAQPDHLWRALIRLPRFGARRIQWNVHFVPIMNIEHCSSFCRSSSTQNFTFWNVSRCVKSAVQQCKMQWQSDD